MFCSSGVPCHKDGTCHMTCHSRFCLDCGAQLSGQFILFGVLLYKPKLLFARTQHLRYVPFLGLWWLWCISFHSLPGKAGKADETSTGGEALNKYFQFFTQQQLSRWAAFKYINLIWHVIRQLTHGVLQQTLSFGVFNGQQSHSHIASTQWGAVMFWGQIAAAAAADEHKSSQTLQTWHDMQKKVSAKCPVLCLRLIVVKWNHGVRLGKVWLVDIMNIESDWLISWILSPFHSFQLPIIMQKSNSVWSHVLWFDPVWRWHRCGGDRDFNWIQRFRTVMFFSGSSNVSFLPVLAA